MLWFGLVDVLQRPPNGDLKTSYVMVRQTRTVYCICQCETFKNILCYGSALSILDVR